MTITDIVNDTYRRTKTNSASFVAADMLIMINNAYNRVVSLVIKADGRWEWDDSNQTDLPIATATITSAQQDYTMSTAHLNVDRVEVKDSSGTWRQLQPYDNRDYNGSSISTLNAITGIPQQYDLIGQSIFLLPVPSYTQVSSLKIFYKRGPAEFTSAEVSTGTKQPGFASLFHELIPLWVSFNYAVENGLSSASGFLAEIQRKEAEIPQFYGKRDKDDPALMSMKPLPTFRFK